MYNTFSKATLLIVFLLTVQLNAFAQYDLKKGNKLFNDKAYSEAIPFYEKYLKDDSSNITVLMNLADCFRLTNNTIKAEKYYGKIVSLPSHVPIYNYYYAQALIANGKYVKGKEQLTEYLKLESTDKRAQEQLKALDNLNEYFKDTVYYSVKRININSEEADFSPVLYKNGLVFTSSRPKAQAVNRIHSWTDKRFSSLYFTEKQDSITFKEPTMFEANLQTKYHDGPVTFSKSYDQFYFTRNNIEEGKVKMSTDNIIKLKIFRSKADKNGKHFEKNLIPFEYNSNDYHCAHPSLSVDGTKLYFASDMPGGKGGMDLYVCVKQGETWSKPENLGDAINTKGNEVFPYIHDDGTLCFSSNGHDGIGALDIYTVSTTDNSSKPINMGAPINSRQDDFGIVLAANSQSGYFTSNRLKGGTDDDIYFFTSSKPKKQAFTVKVKDIASNEPIAKSSAIIEDVLTHEVISLEEGTGVFTANLIPDHTYKIAGMANDYKQNNITSVADAKNPVLEVKLEKAMVLTINTLVLNNTKEKLPVANAVVRIKDDSNKEQVLTTNADGKVVNTVIEADKTYTTVANADGKISDATSISTMGQKITKTYEQVLFLENKGTNCLAGTILSKESNQPIEGVTVTILDLTTNIEIYKSITGADGTYKFCSIEPNKAYKVTADKKEYFVKSENVATAGLKPNTNLKKDFLLERIVVGKAIKIENIYFDLSRWNIRSDAAKELDKIALLLKENPTLVIELGSHTDCRSSKDFNLDLSAKRAKSSASYIVSKGIASERITGKGYGETQLVNKCECEGTIKVPCTEKEHQANRRTEFKVVGFIKDGTVILNP